MPDVWLRYGEDPEGRQDLLLTPHEHGTAAELIAALTRALPGARGQGGAHELAYNEGYVVARLTFFELITRLLPLSGWWRELIEPELRP